MVGLLRRYYLGLDVLGQAGELTSDVPVRPKAADRALPSAAHRLIGLAMCLVAGRDLRLEVAVLGLDDLVVVLAVVLNVARAAELPAGHGLHGCKLRMPGREGFSNPDRLAELFVALADRAAKSASRPRVFPAYDGRMANACRAMQQCGRTRPHKGEATMRAPTLALTRDLGDEPGDFG